MAEHPIWRGHLRLALVSCPVALVTSHTERNNLHFHLINPDTGNRVKMLTTDAETGAELSRRDLAKGYEFHKGEHVLLTDADFESVRVESSSVLKIDKFVPAGSIDPLYFDTGYYMVPDGDAGEDVYAVLREAISASKTMALSRLVIARRERAVAIVPTETGLAVHTLYEAKDVASPERLFDSLKGVEADPAMVELARQLISRQIGKYDPADMEDRYEARLRAIIDAKVGGEEPPEPDEVADDGSNVVDLMAALKQSLGQGAASRTPEPVGRAAKGKAAKPPAKPAAKPARTAPKRPAPASAAAPARKRRG